MLVLALVAGLIGMHHVVHVHAHQPVAAMVTGSGSLPMSAMLGEHAPPGSGVDRSG